MPSPIDPAVLRGLYWSHVTGFEHIGIYALVLYDWLLCLPDEVSLIGSPGASPVKLAYLFCRYWPMLTYPFGIWVDVPLHDRSFCERVFKLPLILQVFNFTGPALIICVRVYAFTGQRRAIVAFLGLCLAIVTIYQLWVASTQAALNPLGGCWPVDVGPAKHLSGNFLAPLAFDTLAIAVVAIHAIRTIPLHLWSASKITRIFIRDGVLYFFAILVLHVYCAAMSFQPDHPISGTGVPIDLHIPSLLACRMVLNLRRIVAQSPTSLPTRDLTAFKAESFDDDEDSIPFGTIDSDVESAQYVFTRPAPRSAQSTPRWDQNVLVIDGHAHTIFLKRDAFQ